MKVEKLWSENRSFLIFYEEGVTSICVLWRMIMQKKNENLENNENKLI